MGSKLRIVDPHVHLWDLARAHYGWLQEDPLPNNPAGDMSGIANRNYLLEDYRADSAGWSVEKIVHVECGLPIGQQLAETDWLQSLADHADWPQGIVAGANLLDPDLRMIVNHAGLPTDRDAAGMERWRKGLRLLAAQPQVSIKISGLGITDRAWTLESLHPVVLECIEIFGIERAMFASDFPVERVHGSFDAFFSAFDAITADFSVDERERLFAANAEAIYRI